jgi:bifunctional UDP-N-acetylglucosamine pyrophosphorylase/glucosamine-1-phosphate N-acetyltransferase
MSTSAIILAAGRSTRLKSRRPKPMHEVCGRPMLDHVLRACYGTGVEQVYIVVGHGKEEILAYFGQDKRITWVEQTEQLGTGHAARMCEPHLTSSRHGGGDVFILAGDGPLIRADVLRTLLRAHRDEHAAASMATAVLDDPTGYGRIIRDEGGNFLEIVEQNDATDDQKAIREVFPSYYCCKADDLLTALSKLTNNNAKREYYLTDIYAHVRRAGRKVLAVQAVTQDDVLGVNTREQLAHVDSVMQARIQRDHRDNGVTIVASDRTYIEAGAEIKQDTVIHPFSYIGRDAVIGSDCTVGPFALIPRGAVLSPGSVVANNATGGSL